MITEAMELDHIVVHVQQGMTAAEQVFSDLGFTLTPEQYMPQFRDLALPISERAAMFGAVTITGALPDHLEQKISANTDNFEIDRTGNNTRVLVKAFATIITFAK